MAQVQPVVVLSLALLRLQRQVIGNLRLLKLICCVNFAPLFRLPAKLGQGHQITCHNFLTDEAEIMMG